MIYTKFNIFYKQIKIKVEWQNFINLINFYSSIIKINKFYYLFCYAVMNCIVENCFRQIIENTYQNNLYQTYN